MRAVILSLFGVAIASSIPFANEDPLSLESAVDLDQPLAGVHAEFRTKMSDLADDMHRRLISTGGEMTTADREAILDLHNSLRSKIAKGQETNGNSYLPSATDMNELLWDPCMERVASDYSAQCYWGHNPDADGDVRSRCTGSSVYEKWPIPSDLSYVGENLAAHSRDPTLDVVTGQVQSWWDEKDDYSYGTASGTAGCSGVCGHFTAMAWANTRYVGCGYAYCPGRLTGASGLNYILTCNYFPGGNYRGDYPWESGTTASNCQADRTANPNTGLCGGGVHNDYYQLSSTEKAQAQPNDCMDSTDGSVSGGRNVCSPTAPSATPSPVAPPPVTPSPVQPGQTPRPTASPVVPVSSDCTDTCSGSSPCYSYMVEIVLEQVTSDLWDEYSARTSRGSLYDVQEELLNTLLDVNELCDAGSGYGGVSIIDYTWGPPDTFDRRTSMTCHFYTAENACKFRAIAKGEELVVVPGSSGQTFTSALARELIAWARDDVGTESSYTITVTYTEGGRAAQNVVFSDSDTAANGQTIQERSLDVGDWFTIIFVLIFVAVLAFVAGWCLRKRKIDSEQAQPRRDVALSNLDQLQHNNNADAATANVTVAAGDGGQSNTTAPDAYQ